MKKTLLISGISLIALISLTLTFTSVNAQKDRRQVHINPITSQAQLQTVHEMTQRMLEIFQQVQTANDLRPSLINELASIAATRRGLMLQLLERDPNLVSQVALPDHILAAL